MVDDGGFLEQAGELGGKTFGGRVLAAPIGHLSGILINQLQLTPQGPRALNLGDPSRPYLVGAKEHRQGEMAIFEPAMIGDPKRLGRFVHEPMKYGRGRFAVQGSLE